MEYFTQQISKTLSGQNVLSIDVEDWFHVCGLSSEPQVPRTAWRVEQNIARLLQILDRHGVQATFFVLGSVAESIPELVPRIAAAGHEIASHGYSHRLVYELTPALFAAELEKTHAVLSRQSGQSPIGFRAPQWSLSRERTPWAYDLLQENGYRYDSSSNPLPFIGNQRGNRLPHKLPAGTGTLWEIPPLVSVTPLVNLPTGGGWGFRSFPQRLIERTIEQAHRKSGTALFYLHPRELDPDGPRLKLSPLKAFVTYGTRRDAAPRLEQLLSRYHFTTLRELVTAWESV